MRATLIAACRGHEGSVKSVSAQRSCHDVFASGAGRPASMPALLCRARTSPQRCVAQQAQLHVTITMLTNALHSAPAAGSRDGAVLLWDARTPARYHERSQAMCQAPVARLERTHPKAPPPGAKGRGRAAPPPLHHSVTAVTFLAGDSMVASACAGACAWRPGRCLVLPCSCVAFFHRGWDASGGSRLHVAACDMWGREWDAVQSLRRARAPRGT